MGGKHTPKRYLVTLQTRSGFFAQYSGAVEVFAKDEDEAVDCALRRLKQTSFPDYSRDMWRVISVERRFK